MRKLFISLALLISSVALTETPPEIRVQLATENALTPIYIGKWQAADNLLSKEYLEELENILLFDFSYNGHTAVAGKTSEKEALLTHQEATKAFNPLTWKGFGIPFVLRASVQQKKLQLAAFSANSSTLKHLKDIPLTGNLSQDRKEIHLAADKLLQALTGHKGVAASRILFSVQMKSAQSPDASWVSEIWECDFDGGNPRQITKEGSYCISPVFVPASQRFLYVSYKLGQPKIYMATLKEGIGRRVVDLKGNQLLPAINAKKDKIAFIGDAGGRTDLFIQAINADRADMGKPVQLFSYPRSTQASPTFSPDGSKIAFVSDKDGPPRIYTIDANLNAHKRENPKLITKQNGENSCPAWSPDGTKLAYSAKTKGVRQIWIYDFDSGEERQLTEGPGNKENPAWAPDSLHVVFNSTDGANSELYIINLNQPNSVKITRGGGKKHYPSWEVN